MYYKMKPCNSIFIYSYERVSPILVLSHIYLTFRNVLRNFGNSFSSLSSYSLRFIMLMPGLLLRAYLNELFQVGVISMRAPIPATFPLPATRNQTKEMKPLSDRLKRTASTLLRQEGWNLRSRFPSCSGNDKSKTCFIT